MKRHIITTEQILEATRDHVLHIASVSGHGWKAWMDYNFTSRTFTVYDHGEPIISTASAYVAAHAYNTKTTRRP